MHPPQKKLGDEACVSLAPRLIDPNARNLPIQGRLQLCDASHHLETVRSIGHRGILFCKDRSSHALLNSAYLIAKKCIMHPYKSKCHALKQNSPGHIKIQTPSAENQKLVGANIANNRSTVRRDLHSSEASFQDLRTTSRPPPGARRPFPGRWRGLFLCSM